MIHSLCITHVLSTINRPFHDGIVIKTVKRQQCATVMILPHPHQFLLNPSRSRNHGFLNGLHPGNFNVESGNRHLQKRIYIFGYPSFPVLKLNDWGCMMYRSQYCIHIRVYKPHEINIVIWTHNVYIHTSIYNI